MKTIIFIVMAMLCLNFSANAQGVWAKDVSPRREEIKPLKVGDKLPETFWQQEHTVYANRQAIKQTLERYKNKPLILDFWATWCSTCIYKFRILEQWKESYKGQLGVLLVNSSNTKDREQRVAELLEGKRAPHQQFKLSSVVNDTYLDALFPHRSLPHYIWIDATGTISAITNAEFVTEAQLQNFLKTNPAKP